MKRKTVQVLVIGAGPAGLAASISCRKAGAEVLLVDSNLRAGGQLFKQIHKFFGSSAHRAGIRGIDIGKELLAEASELGVTIWLNSTVIGCYEGNKVAIERGSDSSDENILEIVIADKIVVASGASENAVRFKGWDIPGVMGAGAVQTMINVNRVLPGKRVLMVGSGNVGLIVSYQLMQAGAKVELLVEALQKVSGYGVHAAKIARAGVKILTSHTVLEAHGTDRVRNATICEVDEKFQPIPGTEQEVQCDTIALAVGLTPLTKIARMFGCKMQFIPVFSGWVPVHNDEMESSAKGIFVVGDVTGIEEANTALEEGRLAGVGVSRQLNLISDEEAERLKKEIWDRLISLRSGSHGVARQKAKELQIEAFSAWNQEGGNSNVSC
jgi:NADPH-dependent 2,4-dienoyl-CoA reductase/sulfur reductase-like enzyme